MTLDKVVAADADNIMAAIGYLQAAHTMLRALGVRRAAILTAQALKSAESAQQQIQQALKGR